VLRDLPSIKRGHNRSLGKFLAVGISGRVSTPLSYSLAVRVADYASSWER